MVRKNRVNTNKKDWSQEHDSIEERIKRIEYVLPKILDLILIDGEREKLLEELGVCKKKYDKESGMYG